MKKMIKVGILLGIYLLLLCTIGYANEAPTLGAGSDWYRTEIDKSTITQITLAKDYAKIGDEIVWNAGYDANPISCYLAGTELTIVGNEYGIKANADSSSLFANFTALTSINGLDILDTSEVTNMKSIFSGCNSLTNINLDNFNTSEVTNMQYMFLNCKNIESLDVTKFDTSKVTNMQGMFSNCSSLQSLDVSNFNTSKVTTMETMFAGCSILSLDVSNFDTSNVTTMYRMFMNCTEMTSIDVDNLVKSTSATTNIGSMFYGCSSLEEIDVSSWDTSKINVMSWLFRDCTSLTKLDVSNFDTRNASDKNEKFYGCSNLIEITVGKFFNSDKFPDDRYYWYTANGTRYTYNNIPGSIARTYYAIDPSKKITITLGTGGSIAREDNIAISGDVVSVENAGSVTLIVTSKDGYHLNTLIIDKNTESEEIETITNYKSMSYTFSNVTSNHTIEATFTECSGGTATCAVKAVCTICGSEYGETLDHTLGGYLTDGTSHWQDCSECEYTAEAECSGGTATCTTKAVCTICGGEYGEVSDHTLGEYQNDGASHWKECSECEYTTEKEECSGGAATCTNRAVCTTCGTQYGEAAGHSLGGYQADGANHWKECSECEYTTEEEECSGGVATCTEKAVCTTCGNQYGEVSEHTLGEYQNDGTNHWKACSECIYTTGEEVCSGGEATCTAQATCTTCGSKYGEVAEHSWDVIAQATCTTPETHMCTSCNEIINVGEALEHDYSGEITCNQNKTDARKCIRCDSTKEIGCTHIYIVTFNTNGGFGSMNTQTFYNGVEQELTANTFSREGYKFVGWSITSSGNKKYSDGESCIFSSDTTLYAVWQILQYQITGEAGEGGFVNPLVVSVNHGESKTFTITSSDNYHIATVFVDNEQIEVKDKKSMVYEFSGVTESHTIEVTFELCETTWLNDSEGHWSKCTVCGIEKVESKVSHIYDNYKYDATKHWQVCSECEYITKEVTHSGGIATCIAKAVCTTCGSEYGEELGHSWVDATCEVAKTCSECGETEGEALGHNWEDATCEVAKTCNECGTTEGEALGHSWVDATCEVAKTCSECGETEGEALGHNWVDATCEVAKTCSECGETEGEALGHNWADATCEVAKICSECGETEGEALGHSWVDATCLAPKTCSRCNATEGEELEHIGGIATSTEKAVCERCGDSYGGYVYTVEFLPNGGSGSEMKQRFPEGVEQALANNTFVREGYDFLGWSSSSSGNVEYSQGAKLILTDDMTIYAIWKKQASSGSGGGSGGGGGNSADEKEEKVEYEIEVKYNKGGSISPSGTVKIEEGKNKKFTIKVEKGYEISDVLIDGKSVGVVKTYTFSNIDDNHEIEVKFRKQGERENKNIIVATGTDNSFKNVNFPISLLIRASGLEGNVNGSKATVNSKIMEFTNESSIVKIEGFTVELSKPAKIFKNDIYITLSDFMNLL